MRYKQAMYWCEIYISDEYGDNSEFEIDLQINKIKKTEIIKLKKNVGDKTKKAIVNQIKNWFLKNAESTKDSHVNAKTFIKFYENDIKCALRIHDWKNLEQIKEDKKRWVRGIDQYTQYIDDGKQYREAEEHNSKCGDMIDLYNKVIKQMEDIIKENKDVEYSYGLYRFKKDGKYEYIRFNK